MDGISIDWVSVRYVIGVVVFMTVVISWFKMSYDGLRRPSDDSYLWYAHSNDKPPFD